MKKILIIIITLILIYGGYLSYNYFYNNESTNETKEIKKDKITNNLKPEETKYIDENPIKVGLYKYYGREKDRELVSEYSSNWNYHSDISSFEVFYTQDNFIEGKVFQNTFKEYLDKYTNIENYKIGYKISFLTNTEEINKTILSPIDTESFFDYLEIYLYNDYEQPIGVWYSHVTEEKYTTDTLLTSIKLTSGKKIDEIISDITVTVFTYDNDDFDESGNYRGISKYTIIVKNNSN